MKPSLAVRILVVNLAAMVATGYLVTRFGAGIPRWLDVGIIGASAALLTIMAPIAYRVVDRFNLIQQDAETIGQAAKTNGIYDYVHTAKVELVAFSVVAAICGVVNGGIAVALLTKDNGISPLAASRLVSVGFALALFVLLFTARVTQLFLQVDTFKKQLFNLVNAEKAKIATLRSLTASVLTPLPETKPARPPRGSRAKAR